ncbi:hypothetical protein FUSO6_05655 [Fusobacterium necrophorum DAB]|nr:hypothetical protein FUSO6_05655 [Fusobacterium necrophorum DAB]
MWKRKKYREKRKRIVNFSDCRQKKFVYSLFYFWNKKIFVGKNFEKDEIS